jgi:hypothetical protein
MLERGEPLGSEQFQPTVEGATTESGEHEARRASGASGWLKLLVVGVRRALIQSRAMVGLALVAAGLVWAIARGLPFYGVSPVHLAYDLDQPPWLLVLVSAWLWYRSRRK